MMRQSSERFLRRTERLRRFTSIQLNGNTNILLTFWTVLKDAVWISSIQFWSSWFGKKMLVITQKNLWDYTDFQLPAKSELEELS